MNEREQYSDKSEQQAAIHREALERAHRRNATDGDHTEVSGHAVTDFNAYTPQESAPAIPPSTTQLNWAGGNLEMTPSAAPEAHLPGVNEGIQGDADMTGGALSGVDQICGFTDGGRR